MSGGPFAPPTFGVQIGGTTHPDGGSGWRAGTWSPCGIPLYLTDYRSLYVADTAGSGSGPSSTRSRRASAPSYGADVHRHRREDLPRPRGPAGLRLLDGDGLARFPRARGPQARAEAGSRQFASEFRRRVPESVGYAQPVIAELAGRPARDYNVITMATITHIVRIGNSHGIRLPKALLEQAQLPEEIELLAEPGRIVVRGVRRTREGWAEAARAMHEHGDDHLLEAPAPTRFDQEAWEWR